MGRRWVWVSFMGWLMGLGLGGGGYVCGEYVLVCVLV